MLGRVLNTPLNVKLVIQTDSLSEKFFSLLGRMSLEKIATASIIIVIINESKKERTQRKNHRPSFKTFIFNKTAFITFRTSHFIIFLLGSRTLPRQTVPRGIRTGGEGRTVENVPYTNQSSLFFIKTVTTDGRQKI